MLGPLRSAPFAILLAFAFPSLAVDGMLEINQTCATQTGCFGNDTPGFPVTITVPGSYRLTSNLQQSLQFGASQENFIEVQNDNVSIDLGGFQISCRVLVIGAGSCGGSGDGIQSSRQATTVRNGTITEMSAGALSLTGDDAVVDGIRAIANHGTFFPQGAITTGEGSQIRNSIAVDNAGDGFNAGNSSSISDCTARNNEGDGFDVGNRSTLRGNIARQNERDGFEVGGGSTVIGNTSTRNGMLGFDLQTEFIDLGGIVQANAITSNTGLGIDATGSSWGYIDNVLSENNGGNTNPQLSGGTELGQNICGGSLVCP